MLYDDWYEDWLWDLIFGWYTTTPPGARGGGGGGGSGGSLYVPNPLLDRLIGGMYFDPITGEWRFPDFSVTVTTTAPVGSGGGSTWTPLFPPPLQGRPPLIGPWENRPPGQDLFGGGGGPGTSGSGETNIPEKPEPRPEVGIVDWRWDPDLGQWLPVFAEKPDPDPKAGIIDWRWDHETGQWVPVFSVTGVTSPPSGSRTTTATTSPPPGGWIYDPFRDVYIPLPGITFVVDVTTTRPDAEYHTAPISTELTVTTTITTTHETTTTSGEGPIRWIIDPVRGIIMPVFGVTATTTRPEEEYHTSPITTGLTPGTTSTTTWQDTTTTKTTITETTTTETTTTETTTTTTVVTPPPPLGSVSGGGAGAPMPGPPAPVVGRPLGESVWQLAQYIPALVPHLGYFLAGR